MILREWMKCRERGSSQVWQICSIKEDGIAITGPGPCRTYEIIPLDEFEERWEALYCVSPNGRFVNEEAHMVYVSSGSEGTRICTFCNRDDNGVLHTELRRHGRVK